MTAYVRQAGRRGGLALRAAAQAFPAGPGFQAGAGAPPDARWSLAALPQRLQWPLAFTAFFAFAGVVISARFRIGQPLVILGIIGLVVQGKQLRWSTVTPLLALWTVWCAFGLIMSDYPALVNEGVVQLSKLCVITLVGVNALRTRPQIRAFSIFALVAFLIYPGRGSFLNWATGAYTLFGRALWNGVYANPNDLAAVAMLLLSVAAGLVVSEQDRRWRLAALVTAGFLTFIIFITQSRAVLIALAVFVVAVLWRAPKRQRVRAAGAVGLVAAVVVAFAPASVWDRISGLSGVTDTENLGQIDSSAEQRYEIWKVARTIIAEHPVFGVGLGAYPSAHGRVAPRPQFKFTARGERDTHSTYLNVIAETGFVGFVLFGAVLAATLAYARRVRRVAGRRDPLGAQQLRMLELGLVAYLVAGIWGSYAKLNILYLHLVLIWCTARVLESGPPLIPSPTPRER